MKLFSFFLVFFICFNPMIVQAETIVNQPVVHAEQSYDFDKMLNFDELEDEMVKMNIIDSIKPIPPHPVIVWIRIIGLPMANAYFAIRRAVRSSWHTVAALLTSQAAKNHEECL